MNSNFVYNNINSALPDLFNTVLKEGLEVGSRAGRVKESTFVGVTLLKPYQREILNPDRKVNLAAQIAETAWVLAGRNDVEFLSHYLPRAKDFSDDGETWRGGYGPRIRRWGWPGFLTDQLAHVVEVLREDPLSRRAVINIYNPEIDTEPGKDIPCNNWLSFSARQGSLDLHVAVRSNDLMWGWSGINVFEWSALQEIVAGMIGHNVGRLHFSITSLHLYAQHWNKGTRIAGGISRSGDPHGMGLRTSPRFGGGNHTIEEFDSVLKEWFSLEERIRNGDPSEMDVESFGEPMLRSWLQILQWWWTGNEDYLTPLHGSRLHAAALVALQPDRIQEEPVPEPKEKMPSSFVEFVTELHVQKHEAYGNSWKKRGEMLGIMANLARKVDRFGHNGAGDTAADTAIDFLVYLAKYRTWLIDNVEDTPMFTGLEGSVFSCGILSNFPNYPNAIIRELDKETYVSHEPRKIESVLTKEFDYLENLVTEKRAGRWAHVDKMLYLAYPLAYRLWCEENRENASHAERNATRSWNPEAGE